MTKRIHKHGYKIANCLYELVNNEVLPGLDITEDKFWLDLSDMFNEFTPKNQALLLEREVIQKKIDQWHLDTSNQPFNQDDYKAFLTDIGYVVPEQSDFHITTDDVDAEVAQIAGPQLVVPLMNARFALNAANARWGSLYDALYGTDVISEEGGCAPTSEGYNPLRGQQVQAYAKRFLDQALPLADGSHKSAVKYRIENQQLLVELNTGQSVGLKDAAQLVGFNGVSDKPHSILCIHNSLHIDIQIDGMNPVGKTDHAGVKDVILESAISTIQDCEDSIAAVDAADKTAVYRNWLGLMKGNLSETLVKNNKEVTRTLNPDRHYNTPAGDALTLSGRSLQFVRNVGHLMTTDAILTSDDQEVPEGILDAMITSLISLHDLNGSARYVNSKRKSIYIVKPKMHGPDEVAFANELFSRVEEKLALPPNTIKMGIMDEERRTSVNLKECIRAASARVAFINTGFLDRTGDEIHTSMQAGPVVRKEMMRDEAWISAYENRNVLIGLKAGFKGRAQIGKGMWATPDEMSAMLQGKIAHPKSGASCAWVPSPTAATLHVMHYHQVKVSDVQSTLLSATSSKEHDTQLDALLTLPLLKQPADLSDHERQYELDNNVQGLLGYVVRWVNQGVGCSKVPDIDNVGRMEDRATLRISSQHICNWLHHGLLTEEQVMEAMRRMAVIVDTQNKHDSTYIPMAPNFDASLAFQAAVELVFAGKEQPSGYTEPLLHKMRNELKRAMA